MPIDIQSQPNPEMDRELINFEDYRRLCNEFSTAYRPVGILSEEMYQGALQDYRTIFQTVNYKRVPVFVSMDYSEGYDVDRCQLLTESEQLFLLTLPVSKLQKISLTELDDRGGVAFVVESDSEKYQQDKLTLMELLTEEGVASIAKDFIDPRINDVESQPAEMSLYAGSTICLDETKKATSSSMDMKLAFKLEGGELLPTTGLTLLNEQDFKENSDIQEQLWDLFKDRFQWLGDYHPVSMEDKREVFDEIIFSETTYVPARFEEGKLVCAGIVMHDLYQCPWIKEQTIKKINDLDQKDIKPMYFFGIAAHKKNDGDEQIKNMQEVVHYYCKLANILGTNFRVIFESSNMSSQYIPDSTRSYINSSGEVKLDDDIHKISSMRYWFIKLS